MTVCNNDQMIVITHGTRHDVNVVFTGRQHHQNAWFVRNSVTDGIAAATSSGCEDVTLP